MSSAVTAVKARVGEMASAGRAGSTGSSREERSGLLGRSDDMVASAAASGDGGTDTYSHDSPVHRKRSKGGSVLPEVGSKESSDAAQALDALHEDFMSRTV